MRWLKGGEKPMCMCARNALKKGATTHVWVRTVPQIHKKTESEWSLDILAGLYIEVEFFWKQERGEYASHVSSQDKRVAELAIRGEF